MAQALIKGVIDVGLYRASEISVSDVAAAQRRRVRRGFGVEALEDNVAVVRTSAVIVLAVKPQILPQVLDDVRAAADGKRLFISIAAGVPIRRIARGLGENARIVRVMPNTPALLGMGMSVLVRGPRASRKDLMTALAIFRGIGDAVAVEDEGLIDPVTGLSGSGPAYVYRFAEAMIEGGIRVGLAPDLARRLAFQTIAGAAAMLQKTKRTPKELREMVSSPGGTTLAGLAVLEGAGFGEAIPGAISAATARSKELGQRAMEAK